MAELHKFVDDTKTPEQRVKPIKARELDDNFTTVRLKLSDDFLGLFKIEESFPNRDELQFDFNVPTTGTYVLGFVDGVFTLLATQDC